MQKESSLTQDCSLSRCSAMPNLTVGVHTFNGWLYTTFFRESTKPLLSSKSALFRHADRC